MNQFVLTPNEARVLSAVYGKDKPTPTQVAVDARLIPSEVESVVSRLVRKNLLVEGRNGHGRELRLTDAGRLAGRAIDQKFASGLNIGSSIAGGLGGLTAGSSLAGALVGSLAAGPVGAVIGAFLGRKFWGTHATPSEEARVLILPSEEAAA